MVHQRPPRLAVRLLRSLLPHAEREEVIADVAAEYAGRAAAHGAASARLWLWRQTLGSIPALLGRTWWRGMTGFEPQANRMHPGGPMLESWIIDTRYAARRLTSRPTYAALAILTLALGAGGTAAIFSVARTLLIDPLPITREEQVGIFWFSGSWTEQEFLRLRPHFPGFQRVGAYRPNDVTLESPGAPLRLVPGVAVSAELFDVLGTAPALGRAFRSGDDLIGAELVALLSHSLWEELGSDPSIVGKRLSLGGIPRTVIGVMPRGFWFPSPATRVWMSTPFDPQSRSGRYTLVGRVADGGSIAGLDGPLQTLAKNLGEQFTYSAQWDKTRTPSVTPAREFFVGRLRPSLIATLAAMAAILLIACANVAALMLGQLDARTTEIAIRTALGANRSRLIQQLVLESLLIGGIAGAGGAVLAALGFQVLVQSLPLGAMAETAHLDWRLFIASIVTALGASAAIALVPGISLWRGSLHATMGTVRTGGIAGRGGRLEGGLVVAQMALAVLLAAGAGLLIRSVVNLRAIDPGVETRGVAILDATMPTRLEPSPRRRTIDDTLARLRALPGVTAAAATQKLPLRGSGDNWSVQVRGKPDQPSSTTAFRMVTRDYFTAIGIPLRSGRGFDGSDRDTSERVVVINEAAAAKYFPGEEPVGQVLSTGFDDRGERIIGVVGNAAEASLTDTATPARYMLYEQLPIVWHQVSFVLRTDREEQLPIVLENAQATIRREGGQLALQQTTTLQTIFDLAVGPAAQIVTLLALLAILALVLGAIGVYGVISHYVTRRSRDYGICIAIGMPPSQIVAQVVGRGARLIALGGAIGIAGALALTRLLSSMLYGVRPTDPLALTGAVIVLMMVGVAAALVPARRASLTDPAEVLRRV
jgi:predicted permease